MTPRQVIAEFLESSGMQGAASVADDLVDDLEGHHLEIVKTLTVQERPVELGTDAVEVDEPTCPTCGGSLFRRVESGVYSEEHYLDTAERQQWTEDQDTSVHDSTPWQCRGGCSETVTDEDTIEALEAFAESAEWKER